MHNSTAILQQIRSAVKGQYPTADLILYGSYARGDQQSGSDLDLLVLIDGDKVTWDDRKRISYPLFDIGSESGVMISTMICPKKLWSDPAKVTPFYENVKREGIIL